MSVFGWIIIHQHPDFSISWNLPWADYKAGFGSIDANFWLGLERMHLLTSSQPYRLRVEVKQWYTNLWFSAEYWSFQIGNEYWSFKIGDELNDQYRLEVDGYSGDAGDALMHEGDWAGDGDFGNYLHNGMMFSANDQDNDEYAGGNCAALRYAGWWYNCCYMACLTCPSATAGWTPLPGNNIYIVSSSMMIKPQ